MAIFGVWMWPKSVHEYGAETVVSRCVRMGVTDIYFLTKGLSGLASCHSDIVPMDCERDLLGELLEAAHQNGIRVHAWFTSASDEHYKQLHPESGRYHYTKGRDRGLISLTDEGYLAYMADFTRELCRSYPIDGLHLDYIRYNHLIYGWSEEDVARYAAEGADIDHLKKMMDRAFPGEEGPECFFEAYRNGDPSVHALARTRRRDVRRFAQLLTGVARAEKPDLILSAALMPEGAYDDVAFADVHYGQNYEDAARLYDLALPMAYSQAYGKNADWVRQVAEGTMKRGLKTLVGVHAYEGGTTSTLQSDLQAVQASKALGACLFREGAFAMGFASGGKLKICNTLGVPITRLQKGDTWQDVLIEPGEEQEWTLPAASGDIRIFSAEQEKCLLIR